MGNNVFANNREVSCKSGEGKSICAFPDVCFTPPENPATPPGVPIPYPNTGMDSDTTEGSKTVKITDKEIMLKNNSYFKKSTGDEAGCAAKKGVMTSVNRGKVYFTSWSMDVKCEGENVVRHMDMTTHNHASYPSNTAPWPFVDAVALAPGGACHDQAEAIDKKCKPANKWKERCPTPPTKFPKPAKKASKAAKDGYRAKLAEHHKAWGEYSQKVKKDPCLNARKCMLVAYKDKDGPGGCCPGQTPDHLVDAASFLEPGTRGTSNPEPIEGWSEYDEHAAPCACAEGPSYYIATHGQLHSRKGVVACAKRNKKRKWKRSDATQAGATALVKTFPKSGCSTNCIEEQLNNYHDKAKDKGKEKDIRAPAPMGKEGRTEYAVNMGVTPPIAHGMNTEDLSQNLGRHSFTTGTVRYRDLAYVVAISDEHAQKRIPHSRIYGIDRGQVGGVDIKWSVCSTSVCHVPAERFIAVAPEGYVYVLGGGESREEAEIGSSLPEEERPDDRGDIREVRGIAGGKAYAVGTARQAYRRDAPDQWTRIDQSAQTKDVNIWEKSFESIDGFSGTDIYTVGWDGEIWHYDGKQWKQIQSPTNLALYKVRCVPDGTVYACGQAGVLLRGKADQWEIIGEGVTEEDFWGLEYFLGKVYVASLYQLYEFDGNALSPVNFGNAASPSTCYHLSAADGIMWSIGAKDILEFDGQDWRNIIG